ncbi:MAG TPA: cytochrome C [Campylobacterales bacterium]|nr:cytochrome C [Campylobacterales bacterium]
MKKLLLTPMVIGTLATAEGYTQADRILDMQKMAQAMQDIQSGFFYNNLDILKDGVKVLTTTIENVRPTEEEINNKDIYEKWLNNDLKMTNKIKKNIKRRAEDIEERFSNGDPKQALQAYSKITEQCLKCHVKLRKW